MNEFDEIRPYHDDEVATVIKQLLNDHDLLDFLGKYHSPRLCKLFPSLVRFATRMLLKRALGSVTSIYEFQTVISYYAKKIVADTSAGFTYSGIDDLSADMAYLFVGNHRDIAGDSMFVDYALWLSQRETVRIAVGDNLVQRAFATALMKLNKSFFIRRSEEGVKKIYAAILESSKYIHQSIADGHSIWIAQSEGRAKDGIDVTDPAIVKMFALAKRKQALSETVSALNIVPVSIAYEFDPCDCLKAKERYEITTHGCYEKEEGEDLLSLVKGLGEEKGRICLRFGNLLAGDYQTPEEVANAIDRQVLDNYQLYYINYWALSKLASSAQADSKYADVWNRLEASVSFSDTAVFQERLDRCSTKWQQYWLEMYANPVVNKYSSKCSSLAPV